MSKIARNIPDGLEASYADIKLDTISDLVNLTGTPPEIVWVSGYHTKGDGSYGSHIFEWEPNSTEAHNGGTIIELGATFPNDWSDQTQLDAWYNYSGGITGRYRLRYLDAVNVKCFGSKGDGVSDDTKALKQSLNACLNITSDANLTYIVSDRLLVSNNSIIDFKNSIIKVIDNINSMANAGIIDLADKSTPRNIRLKNIKIDGNRNNQGTVEVGVNNFNGIKLLPNDNVLTDTITIENCHSNNCTQNGFIMAGKKMLIKDCSAYDNMAIGFIIGSPSNGDSYNNSFLNLKSFNNGDDLYAVPGCDNYFFQNINNSIFANLYGDYTTATQGTGLKLAVCNSNTLDNIQMFNSPWHGLHLQSSSLNNFSNISIIDNKQYGINVTSTEGKNSIDNTFSSFRINNNDVGILVNFDVINYPSNESFRNKFIGGEIIGNSSDSARIDSKGTVVQNSIIGGTPESTSGGGILLKNLGSNAIDLTNIDITNNTIMHSQKGIYIGANATVDFTSCIFNNNLKNIINSGYENNIEDWQVPTLLDTWNGTVTNRQPLVFRKKGTVVEIKGVVKDGTQGSTICTLPVGYGTPGRIDFFTRADTSSNIWANVFVNESLINNTYPGGEMDIRISFDTV